jgi:hypothetical protein
MRVIHRFRLCFLGGVLAALAMLTLAGCSGLSSGSSGSGGTPGQLRVDPATMNFGNVAVGDSARQTGTLTAGNADVTVTSAVWDGQGYSVTGVVFPFTVPAGNIAHYTVTFAPQAAGNSSGRILFTSNASNASGPQAFTGTGTQSTQHSVSLTWNPSTNVVGYNVYRGTQPGGPYTKLNSALQLTTNYTDSQVASGSTYYYVATSVDSNDAESVYSNQTQAVVP